MLKLFLPVILSVAVYYYLAARKPYSPTKDPKDLLRSYDYIIVGGGTAGCVVAARLSEDPNVSVLVLEAGYDDTEFKYTKWASTEKYLELTDFDWKYMTTPQDKCCESLNNRQLRSPRAFGLGGCSSHYGGAHVRGAREDYDHWLNQGNEGWGYEDVLPYFAKMEDLQIDRLKDKKYHGVGGPMKLVEAPISELTKSLIEATKNHGFKWRDDINGVDDLEGFAYAQVATGDGYRQSTALAYLRPAMERKNLHVVVHAQVTKILFSKPTSGGKPKAIGVEYIRHGIKLKARAKKEVIISGGAYNSPHILMLSGIGPKEQLTEFGIPVLVDNPAVGKNLVDHPFAHVVASINDTVGYYGVSPDDPIRFALAELQFHLFGTGPLASAPIEIIGFTRSGLSKEKWPDLELYLLPVEPFKPYNVVNLNQEAVAAIDPKEREPTVARMAVYAILLHPHNAGEIRLASANPLEKPIVDPKYFHNDLDLEILAKGLKITLDLITGPETKRYDLKLHEKQAPGCEKLKLWSDEHIKCHARSRMLALYHPVGTCRMGKEGNNSVVDHRLRVHGVQGLRVADTSVFPDQVSANTNAPTIMVAEKAADLIKEDNRA